MTNSPEAYEWYTMAKFRLSPENKEDIDSCIVFLHKAIAADDGVVVVVSTFRSCRLLSLSAPAHSPLSSSGDIQNKTCETFCKDVTQLFDRVNLV